MTVGLVLFLTVAAVALIVVICGLVVFLERNFPSAKYDERQKTARGSAYRFSNGVGMVYWFGLFAYFVFHTGKSEWVLEPFLLVMIGILIQLQSFHVYCLMTHSALPLGEKPAGTIIGYFLLGGMYLFQYYNQYIPEDAAGFTGAGSMNLFQLMAAFDFFALAVLHLIAMLRKEKE